MPDLPEPAWNEEGQKTFKEPSALCSMRIRPSVVSGLLMRLIQSHFFDVDNIEDEKLKPYYWRESIEDTRMIIQPSYLYDQTSVENRPAILVASGPMQVQEFAIANQAIPHVEKNGNFKGHDYYVELQGSHEIHCVGQTGMESLRLAEEVFFRLLEFHPSIKDDLKLGDFKVNLLSGLSKLDEAGERYTATIKTTWRHIHGWSLVAIAPILKKTGHYNAFDEF